MKPIFLLTPLLLSLFFSPHAFAQGGKQPSYEQPETHQTLHEPTAHLTAEQEEAKQMEEILQLSLLESRVNLLRQADGHAFAECSKNQLREQLKRVAEIPALKDVEEHGWSQPFPIAVFGTLRHHFKNHLKMGTYLCGSKAFLPHFVASGLSLMSTPHETAPFEVYFYESQADWQSAIQALDPLESFHPKNYVHDQIDRGYIRVLATVHLLPTEYSNYWYEKGNVWEEGRSCTIDTNLWSHSEKTLAWIYISKKEYLKNMQSLKHESPIRWPMIHD